MKPYVFVLRRLAEIDIIEAYNWYERQETGVGIQFEDSIADLFERIVRDPFAYPHIGSGVRKARARKFPYHVFYRVNEHSVVITAVFHVARDPDEWKKR